MADDDERVLEQLSEVVDKQCRVVAGRRQVFVS
jgi:hypothetical protein